MTVVGKTWGDQEREHLVRYWCATRSIILTAAVLGRSTSAIQTAASRFNLPKRPLSDETHRRAWNSDDEAKWQKAKRDLTRRDGRLPLDKTAVRLHRSVDVVANRLMQEVGGDHTLFLRRIVVPQIEELPQFEETLRGVDEPPKAEEVSDARNLGKMRKCLSCTRPFWSHSAGNRICNKCKSSSDSLWEP
ncbi:hypothetical protein ACVIGB_000699 [Bradyrhizobium sp. USDA 4341]